MKIIKIALHLFVTVSIVFYFLYIFSPISDLKLIGANAELVSTWWPLLWGVLAALAWCRLAFIVSAKVAITTLILLGLPLPLITMTAMVISVFGGGVPIGLLFAMGVALLAFFGFLALISFATELYEEKKRNTVVKTV